MVRRPELPTTAAMAWAAAVGLVFALTLLAPSSVVAQSCGELGGSHCSPTASCPTGYESLGETHDCTTCCREQASLPSCGEMGGNACSDSGFCPEGYDALGNSSDCHPCCRQQEQPLPTCSAMGGDACGEAGSCPAGTEPLGPSSDCHPCCRTVASPPGTDDAEVTAPRLPFSMACNATYQASVTMRNTGSTTWTSAAGYNLGAVGDSDPFFAGSRVPLPAGASVPPGSSHDFTMTLTAPPSEGSQVTDWRMVREGVQWFGGVASETVSVRCSCGNGVCDEPSATCPQDCAASVCNGNGVCDPGEDAAHCPLDGCVCTPTLSCVGKCGIHDDGCGHPVDCGACECVPNVPAFTASRTQARAGDPITFTANASLIVDPPAPQWDLGNAVHRSGSPLTYTYPAPGTFNVVLTASESACGRTQVSSPMTVIIDPLVVCAPEVDNPGKCCGNGACDLGDQVACPEECPANPGFTVAVEAPPSAAPGEDVPFHAAVTTNPGEAVSDYRWTFGDGGAATGQDPTHAYDEDGLYVVSVTATTTTGLFATASKVISIQSTPDVEDEHHLECSGGGCEHDVDFRFDQTQNRLVPRARFWIDRFSGQDWRKYHVVARAVITDSANHVRFDSDLVDGYELWSKGLSPDIFTVEIDFHDFAPAAFNPRPGRWRLRMEAFYRPVERPAAKPIAQGSVLAEVIIDPCLGGECQIDPKKIEIYDGTSGTFKLSNPLPGRTYDWKATFSIALENGYPFTPNAHLTPTMGTSVTAVKPTWVAVPRNPTCVPAEIRSQALSNSKYNLEAADVSGGAKAKGEFTVVVPWGFRKHDSLVDERGGLAAGVTSRPAALILILPFDNWTLCDDRECRPNLSSLVFERRGAVSRLATSLETSESQFKAKTWAHEQDHVAFWEGDRCGAKYFTIEGLKQQLQKCIDDRRCVVPVAGSVEDAQNRLLGIVKGVEDTYYQRENAAVTREVHELAEFEAYQKGDTVAPDYIYKNCGRFRSYECPR